MTTCSRRSHRSSQAACRGLLCALLLLLAWTSVFAEIPAAPVRRTVMIYMIGSNLESTAGGGKWASGDLREILRAQVPLEHTQVLLCAGGSNRWHTLDLAPGEVCDYILTVSEGAYQFEPITEKRVTSMAQPDTLSDFLSACVNRCPADAYDLILWDHGGGPLAGFGVDEAHGDEAMSVASLVSALEHSPFRSMPLELLCFDCCLMGSLEVATAMAPFARYMIASEETDRAGSWDFSFLGGSAMRSASAEALAEQICASHEQYLHRIRTPGVLACYRLPYASAVCEALNGVFASPVEVPSGLAQVARDIRAVKQIDCWGSDGNYNLYDLGGFFTALAERDPDRFGGLPSLLEQLIVCRSHSASDYGLSGVSFYFPLERPAEIRSEIERYSDHPAAASLSYYRQFISQYSAYSQSAAPFSAPLQFDFSVLADGTRSYTMHLPEELCQSIVSASYSILSRQEQDVYLLVEMGRGLTLSEDGALTMELAPCIPMLSGGSGQPWDEFTLIEAERTPGEIHCHLPMLHTREYHVTTVRALVSFASRSGRGEVVSIHEGSDTEMANPIYDMLQKDDFVSVIRYTKRFAEDDEGRTLPFSAWSNASTAVYYSEIRIGEDGLQIAMRPCDENGAYYVQLQARDVGGHVYASPLMPFSLPEDVR